MSRDELKVMDGGKCILEIRKARPFYSDKFDISKHKNYKLISDYNEKNIISFRHKECCLFYNLMSRHKDIYLCRGRK